MGQVETTLKEVSDTLTPAINQLEAQISPTITSISASMTSSNISLPNMDEIGNDINSFFGVKQSDVSYTDLKRIPFNIWLKIFQKVDLSDLMSLNLVSKMFRRISYQSGLFPVKVELPDGTVLESSVVGRDTTPYEICQQLNLYDQFPEGEWSLRVKSHLTSWYDNDVPLLVQGFLGDVDTLYFDEQYHLKKYAIQQTGSEMWVNSTFKSALKGVVDGTYSVNASEAINFTLLGLLILVPEIDYEDMRRVKSVVINNLKKVVPLGYKSDVMSTVIVSELLKFHLANPSPDIEILKLDYIRAIAMSQYRLYGTKLLRLKEVVGDSNQDILLGINRDFVILSRPLPEYEDPVNTASDFVDWFFTRVDKNYKSKVSEYEDSLVYHIMAKYKINDVKFDIDSNNFLVLTINNRSHKLMVRLEVTLKYIQRLINKYQSYSIELDEMDFSDNNENVDFTLVQGTEKRVFKEQLSNKLSSLSTFVAEQSIDPETAWIVSKDNVLLPLLQQNLNSYIGTFLYKGNNPLIVVNEQGNDLTLEGILGESSSVDVALDESVDVDALLSSSE